MGNALRWIDVSGSENPQTGKRAKILELLGLSLIVTSIMSFDTTLVGQAGERSFPLLVLDWFCLQPARNLNG